MSKRIPRALVVITAIAGIAGAVAWSRGGPATTDAPATTTPQTAPRPRLAVDKYEHNFGIFDVGDKGTHAFAVRNEGDAPLTLELLRTSCKCTLADLKNVAIPPGREKDVRLDWEAVEPTEMFGHGARIRTNDPDQPEITLSVAGRVRAKMAIFPELVYWADAPRNAERKHVLTLFSQAFDDVKVTKIESTHPFVTATLTDERPSPPGERPALFSRTLQLTCRTNHEVAPFHGTIRVHYAATGPFAPKVESPFEFHFTGETVGDVSLHGRQVVGRVLNFGTVASARGAKERVYLHVRNDDGKARPRVEKLTPDFLQVRVDEPKRLSATMMRYPVEIEVPIGSPAATFVGSAVGEIRLKTDHPSNPQVRFNVSLIVGQ